MAESDNGKLVYSGSSLVYDPGQDNRLVYYVTPPEEEPEPDPIPPDDPPPPVGEDPQDPNEEDPDQEDPDSTWADVGASGNDSRTKGGYASLTSNAEGPMPNAEPTAWRNFLSSFTGSVHSVVERQRRKRDPESSYDHSDYVNYSACAWTGRSLRPHNSLGITIEKYWRITQIKIQVTDLSGSGWGTYYRPVCWVHFDPYRKYPSTIPSMSWSYWTSPRKFYLPLQNGIYIYSVSNMPVGDSSEALFHSVGFYAPQRAISWTPTVGGAKEEKRISALIRVVGALWSI